MSARTRLRTIVWFRDDLRFDDNPALLSACAAGGETILLFILEDGGGPRPLGGAARWWLHHSLESLSETARGFGQRLILRRGPALPVLREVIAATGASRLFWNRRYGPAALADGAIIADLAPAGVVVSESLAGFLFEPSSLARDGRPLQVFSAFRRRAASLPPPSPPQARPNALPPPVEGLEGETLDQFGLLPRGQDWTTGLAAAWAPGEAGAHRRLQAFLDGELRHYEVQRDRPALASTSQLSPHLRFGEISPHRVLAEASRAEASGGAGKFAAELNWREFAWHVFAHRPDLATRNLRSEFDSFPWQEADPSTLRAWRRGMTGYPVVDAGMRQLWRTGWMHNRARMICASFLTKHLLIDWRIGEAWFWDTLVDADPANNPFNWQWVAGSGFDAQPYFRIFNPVLQGERFDPDGTYVRAWVPELARLPARFVHSPWKAPPMILAAAGIRLGETYPEPIVDHASARRRALAAFAATRDGRSAPPGGMSG
jgi:deoxyribodipyrimidine photo-lyase